MSDTTELPPDPDGAAAPAALPRSMNIALLAIAVQVGLSAVYAALFPALSSSVKSEIIKSNLKAKPPKVLCTVNRVSGCLDVNHLVRTAEIATGVGTLVVGGVVIWMVLRLRRGNRTARSVYVGISIVSSFFGFAGSPLGLLAVASAGQVLLRTLTTLAAAAGVAAIVFLFQRDSGAFFNSHSPRPGATAARPGFGSLFRPQAPPRQGTSPAGDSASSIAARSRSSKAKSRNDAEAIARGAELARNRAKASKSRRTGT